MVWYFISNGSVSKVKILYSKSREKLTYCEIVLMDLDLKVIEVEHRFPFLKVHCPTSLNNFSVSWKQTPCLHYLRKKTYISSVRNQWFPVVIETGTPLQYRLRNEVSVFFLNKLENPVQSVTTYVNYSVDLKIRVDST